MGFYFNEEELSKMTREEAIEVIRTYENKFRIVDWELDQYKSEQIEVEEALELYHKYSDMLWEEAGKDKESDAAKRAKLFDQIDDYRPFFLDTKGKVSEDMGIDYIKYLLNWYLNEEDKLSDLLSYLMTMCQMSGKKSEDDIVDEMIEFLGNWKKSDEAKEG
jgi:hypothetical protein